MLKTTVLETGPLSVNTYIINKDDRSECIVIDPADGKAVKEYLDENGQRCMAILLTHGHFDHILGVECLRKAFNAEVYIHEQDARALESDKENLAAFMGITVEKCNKYKTVTDGSRLHIAGIDIDVMHTPGHSRGSVCYIIESEKVIFSGDTLFRLSVGRTDLYGSCEEDLVYSILYKLYMLHGDYTVLPGHEESTTLDFERQNNPVTAGFDYE